MKIDVYTKIVLTAIAVCLAVLTLNQISVIPGARAEQHTAAEPQSYGSSGPIDVRIVGVGMNVKVPVTIDGRGYGFTLPVSIDNVTKTIPVKVENSYIYTKSY